ncbi:hypothetical protein LTR10_011929 [Elasticomyces elasticus]|nr:hypothetical protein LTR10_011929 [Elasticomyces elasticus]KAK4968870.1 hypothetical protein LTR42_009149 [Elasticomyces elasticus]
MATHQPATLMSLPNEVLLQILGDSVPGSLSRPNVTSKHENRTRAAIYASHMLDVNITARYHKLAAEAFFLEHTHDLKLKYCSWMCDGTVQDHRSAWYVSRGTPGAVAIYDERVVDAVHRSPLRHRIRKLRLEIVVVAYVGEIAMEKAAADIPALLESFEGLREVEVVFKVPDEEMCNIEFLGGMVFANVEAWGSEMGRSGGNSWEREVKRLTFDCEDEKIVLENGAELCEVKRQDDGYGSNLEEEEGDDSEYEEHDYRLGATLSVSVGYSFVFDAKASKLNHYLKEYNAE